MSKASEENEFFQTPPELHNQYDDDNWLKILLKWRLPEATASKVQPELRALGAMAAGEMLEWAKQAEREIPRHIPYDEWGRRIDKIEVSSAWNRMERIAAEHGIVAEGYERKHGPYSRMIQFAKLYLYHPSSALFSCPLAMTDGAARILELLGTSALKDRVFRKLISRDPKQFWTSGQWMTEKSGGSDVSETSTVAKKAGDSYKLYGTKWFTSSVTSPMAMALARIEGAPEGSKGLSLFYLETHKANGELNEIVVHRLKDKLGSRALPTAELTMNGTPAQLLGEPGQGVRNIATMLNITRLYNSVCASAQMRRALALLNDYSSKRIVFGRPLEQQPAFQTTKVEQEMQFVGGLVLTLHAGLLLGKSETGDITNEEQAVLRLITPIVKMMTGKWAVHVTSEVLEAFGGAGYIEDTGLPVIFRDAQVFPIWEGPTNVLALDVLRVIGKPETLEMFLADAANRAKAAGKSGMTAEADRYMAKLKTFSEFMSRHREEDTEFWQYRARALAFNLGRLMSASLLLELAGWIKARGEKITGAHAAVLRRWIDDELVIWPIVPFDGPSKS